MNAERKSLSDSFTNWIAALGYILRNALAWHIVEGNPEARQTMDADFYRWVVNDPMVTLNPASRYGDDATGFLAGSEGETPQLHSGDD